MSDFIAQALVETRNADGERRFELTFADARGRRQTISLPNGVAADLAAVLTMLAKRADASNGQRFTKVPKNLAVGRAQHERLVLIKFDDDPPYALDPDKAEDLWRGMREETEAVASMRAPAIQ
jgi:hypothetical protein